MVNEVATPVPSPAPQPALLLAVRNLIEQDPEIIASARSQADAIAAYAKQSGYIADELKRSNDLQVLSATDKERWWAMALARAPETSTFGTSPEAQAKQVAAYCTAMVRLFKELP